MKIQRRKEMKTHQYKKQLLSLAAAAGLMLLGSTAAQALGTAAGTAINNTANVTYSVGGAALPPKASNTITTTVAQITAVTVVQTNSNVTVTPGLTGVAAAFTITNTGNGDDTFDLTSNSVVVGDQFDPTANAIHLDVNGDGVYQLATEPALVGAVVTAVLAADATAKYFVVNSIPAVVADLDLGDTELTASSATNTAAAGTVAAGAGVGGVDAVAGAGGGTGTGTGTYIVSSVINVPGTPGPGPFPPGDIPGTYNPGENMKFATINDGLGGTSAVPGATITYTLIFSITGSGTATAAMLSDVIPTNTTYVPGSITFDNTGVGAAAAVPVADGSTQGTTTAFAAAGNGTVSVLLGDMTVATAIQIVTFQVTID